ncbi:MAG TPA: glycosyltransferase family 2 protein [Rhodothermales bacterium]|nr:glycosyltransferase family 2 protein [Rhodothermales bacterium]
MPAEIPCLVGRLWQHRCEHRSWCRPARFLARGGAHRDRAGRLFLERVHWAPPFPRLVDSPRVTVVIVTWNGRELLERFLPSVLATDYPDLEVVVADNASTDGTVEWLAAHHPGVVVARHEENLLFAEGNNRAVPQATGDVLVFLNNDVEVPPDWLRPLVAALAERPDVAAVQPKLLQLDRQSFEYAGAAGGFLDRYGFPFTRGRLFEHLEADRGQYDAPRDVTWATGAALAVRRDAFEAAGGFDPTFEMHMEEIDLCWRLWRSGWRVRCEPTSEAYHLGGASLPRGSARKTYYNYRNGLVMLAKNLPQVEARRVLRARRAFDTVAAARLVTQGRAEEARAIRRGWRDARERIAAVTPPPPGEPQPPLYTRSIVIDHFARGRDTFASLPAEAFTPPGSATARPR